ncbi:MAG: winged helix-turn-helix domain-containing protein [Steroidobacteraceae bacterium]|jgi:molybdate transport system regulatory protein
MFAPVVRFRVDFAKGAYVGPGKIDLLEAIRDSGSLSQAARDLGMSYRRAWLLVDSLKQSFREPVTVATTGGKRGGGVRLTEFGRTLIDSYRDLERDIAKLAARRLHAIIPAVIRRATTDAKSARRPIVHKRDEA